MVERAPGRGAPPAPAPDRHHPGRVHHREHHEAHRKHRRVDQLGRKAPHAGQALDRGAQHGVARRRHGRLPHALPEPHRHRVQPVRARRRVPPGEGATQLVVLPHPARLHRNCDVVLIQVLQRRHAHVEHLIAAPLKLLGEPSDRLVPHQVRAARVRRASPVRRHAVDPDGGVAAQEQQAQLAELLRVRAVLAVLEVGPERVHRRIARVEHVVARVYRRYARRLVAVRDQHLGRVRVLGLCQRNHSPGVRG